MLQINTLFLKPDVSFGVYFVLMTGVTQTCRPVRDGIFVTADFNRRAAIINCSLCLGETTSCVYCVVSPRQNETIN